jgi:hypothetical protein
MSWICSLKRVLKARPVCPMYLNGQLLHFNMYTPLWLNLSVMGVLGIRCLFKSIWNKEELPDQWKESIIVPVHKKGDKTDCSNYRGIPLLSTSYKILSIILLSRLRPYIDKIIGDHQCGFQRNRPTTDQIFCIRQILEKKMGV